MVALRCLRFSLLPEVLLLDSNTSAAGLKTNLVGLLYLSIGRQKEQTEKCTVLQLTPDRSWL